MEEPVISKTARVVEEVVVGKEVRERTETVGDVVRRTDVEIEELDSDSDSDVARSRSRTEPVTNKPGSETGRGNG